MSEPLKKPGLAPESYDPRAVPEIISMAKQAQGAPQLKGLPENVLRGVPHMGYGNPTPVCYTGSVLRLMEYVGDPSDERELFALSGAGLCFPWQYQSCCDEISIIPEIPLRTFAALGYESEYCYEPDISGPRKYSKEFYMEKIKRSIDHGRPVIGFGFTQANFTCLITGYYDNGNGLYLRAYWSPEGIPEGYDTEKYYYTDDWYKKCHGIVAIGEKNGERLAGEKAYAHICETAKIFSQMTSVTAAEGQIIYTGFSAFDAMIAWLREGGEEWNLRDGGVYLKPCGILLLQYYRSSLREYLEALDKNCPGVVNPAVLSAIRRMSELVPGRERSDWDLGKAVDRKLKNFANMRKPELREKVAACVERIAQIDKEIFDYLIGTEDKCA